MRATKLTTLFMAVLPMLVLGVLSSATPAQGDSFAEYATRCRTEIGKIPAFSCADGVVVPITVNGKTPTVYTKNMTCDRPALLPNGPESDGQCVPGSRILNLSNANHQVSVMCRQKRIRPKDSLNFDEIDVIAHNPKTGATCWFQATATSGGAIDGTAVPSPTDPSSGNFYNRPEAVVHDGCGNCHDNDPFMYSPFVGQVWGWVPVNPFGRYFHVNLPELEFDSWPTTQISPRDSTCTGCHRIGVNETCGQLANWATGRERPPGSDPKAASYPLSHSMPPFHGQTEDAWRVINQEAANKIYDCCLDPTRPECRASAIPR